MKEERKIAKKKVLDDLLRDFHSPKRWEKVADTFQEDNRSDGCIENRDFLIQKYMSKFPLTKDIPLNNKKIIRL